MNETDDQPGTEPSSQARDPRQWHLRPLFRPWHVMVVAILLALLAWSGKRNELDRAASGTAQGLAHAVGLAQDSEVSRGWHSFFGHAFPLEFAERTEVARIEGFDPQQLPPLAYVRTEPQRRWDVLTDDWVEDEPIQVLIVPYGYLLRVGRLMLQTIEIGLWGTILALLIAMPLCVMGAANYSLHRSVYTASRAICSFSRAMPELIIAMFFVLLFGFGPVAGILALALHSFGFLGKFFADDIENADRGPQEALLCTGANRLQVLRYAVLPQVAPQFLAYSQYILERNVRSATVLGIVGAGGIGMELKGRWDLSDFGHVSTILLVIFLTVLTLEFITQRLRRKLI